MDSGGLKYDKKALYSDSCYIAVHINSCFDCDGNTMSRVTEMIDVDTMIGRTLIDGKIVAEFKCAQCDQCQRIEILDRSGYQRDVSGEPILWFCSKCRK
jgi:hypothetical protein